MEFLVVIVRRHCAVYWASYYCQIIDAARFLSAMYVVCCCLLSLEDGRALGCGIVLLNVVLVLYRWLVLLSPLVEHPRRHVMIPSCTYVPGGTESMTPIE